MSQKLELYHGTDGDNILNILRDGAMRPNAQHQIYYSESSEDVVQHGADRSRKASFAIKARITLPAGASVKRERVHGNPRALIVTTTVPVPTEILELYVRGARNEEGEMPPTEIIRGADAAKAYLLRPH